MASYHPLFFPLRFYRYKSVVAWFNPALSLLLERPCLRSSTYLDLVNLEVVASLDKKQKSLIGCRKILPALAWPPTITVTAMENLDCVVIGAGEYLPGFFFFFFFCFWITKAKDWAPIQSIPWEGTFDNKSCSTHPIATWMYPISNPVYLSPQKTRLANANKKQKKQTRQAGKKKKPAKANTKSRDD